MGDRSPLMFESDEEDDVETEQITPLEKDDSEEKKSPQESPTKKKVDQLRTVLSGVPPPPTLTFLQMDAKHLLELWNQNIQTFNLQDVAGRDTNLVEKDLSTKSWQESQTDYYYGIYYNRSTLSEQLEALSLKYQERYVGAETSTSVNGLSSRSPPKTASARKRARRLAHGGHSPGRRLSYLARRRNTFSSLDLRSQQPAKMILVNNKAKPNVRKKLRNSATKNVPGGGVALAASIPKRALFQSPENGKKQSKTPVQSSQRTRRALFSSSSSSTRDSMPVLTRQTEPGLKRQRETDAAEQPLQKRDSVIASDVKRRCTRSLLFEENEKSVIPSSPPQLTAQTLSKLHKQKLLWAVSGALREEGIKIKDTLFQPCASLLFNQCKNIWLKESTTNVCKQVTSTSDKMLEIVKRYCSDTVAKVSAKLNKNGGVKSVCDNDRSVCGSLQPAKPPLQTLPQNVLLPPDNKSEATDITKKPCRLTDTKRPADDASLSIGFKNCTSENDSDTQTCTVTNAS